MPDIQKNVRLSIGQESQNEWQPPRMFAVIFHNDDFTTMDFVVTVLIKIFNKSRQEAAGIMMAVHEQGSASAGVYPFDIAVTKKILAEQMAEGNGFPLRITVSEA